MQRILDALSLWAALITLVTALPCLFLPWIYFPRYVAAALNTGMVIGSGAGFAYARAKYGRTKRDISLTLGRSYFGGAVVALVIIIVFSNLYNIELVKGLGLQAVHDGINGVWGIAEGIGLFVGGGFGFCLMMSIVLIVGRPWRA